MTLKTGPGVQFDQEATITKQGQQVEYLVSLTLILSDVRYTAVRTGVRLVHRLPFVVSPNRRESTREGLKSSRDKNARHEP